MKYIPMIQLIISQRAGLDKRTESDGGPHSSFKQQRKGHPGWSGPKSKAPQHDKIVPRPLSFLAHTHPTPTPPLEGPETPFRAGGLWLYEARGFIRKARACRAPGLNGISFKLYKNCPTVLEQLVCLLQRAWREVYVAQEWCLADGVWIPNEEKSVGVGSFRPISLLNVKGKIFFGVIARWITSFLLQNKYISTSVQRAGIPRFPGCLEHAQMIWNSWMRSTRRKNSTIYGLTWPIPMDLCLTTASSLHWSSSTSQRKWLTS